MPQAVSLSDARVMMGSVRRKLREAEEIAELIEVEAALHVGGSKAAEYAGHLADLVAWCRVFSQRVDDALDAHT